MSERGILSKFWVFTLNNPGSNDVPKTWDGVEWATWQREKGESGTEHLQGYVIMDRRVRLPAMKKLSQTAHWEPRRGTHDQAKAYASKEDTRVAGPWVEPEGAEPNVGQGKRNDLLELKRKLDQGAKEAEIAEELFPVWVKYYKVCSRYRMLKGVQRTWATETLVLWGPPGSGKSSKALELGGPEAYWLPKPAGQSAWFDGYEGQEVVVIDEFYGWIARDLMCRLCDRYPLNVETKGGVQPFLAKKIIITSNEHPVNWWKKIGLGAMARRLSAPMGRIEFVPMPEVAAPALLSGSPPLAVSQQGTPLQEGDGYIDADVMIGDMVPEPGIVEIQPGIWQWVDN